MTQHRVRRTAAGLALVLIALILGLIPAGGPGLDAKSHPLVVLATASNRGEVDPCG